MMPASDSDATEKKTKPNFDLPAALKLLGKSPDAETLARLVANYPTYNWEHRKQLLVGYFSGKTQAEMIADKLKAKVISTPISKQAMGGHGRWVKYKSRSAIIRILYLRYRLDDHLTQIQANARILKLFDYGEDSNIETVQSTVRKETYSPILDKHIVEA